MKKLAIINDLSGFGRCSLTAAISVISAMGVQACPLPTAILSAQTGFPSYKCYDFSNHMVEIQNEWKKLQAEFDGIYTGFVSSETQIDHILSFIDSFYTSENFLLVDPIMGDDGITYDMFTPSLKEKIKHLTKLADIITPNLTELCLLTDTDYNEIISISDKTLLLDRIHKIGKDYCINGPKQMVVTGIRYKQTATDTTEYIGNSYISDSSYYHTSSPALGGSYSGTGDLFASCLAGGMVKNTSISTIMERTKEFLQYAIQDSVDNQVPYIEGVNFEKYLYLLHS